MATVYGVQSTKSKTVPPDLVAVNQWGGRVRCAQDQYEAAALEAGSTIYGPKIPKGAIIVGGQLLTDDLSADATIAVGISGSTGKYIAATVCTTANQKTEFSLIDSLGVELTAEEEILLTTGVSAITGTVKIMVFYVLD
jgi:hypothetical protein